MVLCALTFAIITAGLERPAFANADLLSGERARLYREIKEMQWQERLSAIDTEKVVLGLRSLHQELTKEALKVVALHRSKELLPVVEEVETAREAGFMGSQVPTLVRLVAEALRQDHDPVARLRTLLVEGQLPREWLMVETSCDPTSLGDQIIDIVATDEAKRLRRGGKANAELAQVHLNEFASELLHYSKMKPEVAIDDIFYRLRHATIIGREQSAVIEVLESYGHTAITRLTSKLLNERDLNSMRDNGISVMFQPILMHQIYHESTPEGTEQFNRLIARLVTEGSPQVRQDMQTVKETLQRLAQQQTSRPAPVDEMN
jgi:hypothetical protein